MIVSLFLDGAWALSLRDPVILWSNTGTDGVLLGAGAGTGGCEVGLVAM